MIEANKALKQKKGSSEDRNEERTLNRMTNELIVDMTTTNVSSMVKSHEIVIIMRMMYHYVRVIS